MKCTWCNGRGVDDWNDTCGVCGGTGDAASGDAGNANAGEGKMVYEYDPRLCAWCGRDIIPGKAACTCGCKVTLPA